MWLGSPYNIIKKILVTEKSYGASKNSNGNYCFIVDTKASKGDVASFLEERYKVKVSSVNTLIRKGKIKRRRNGRISRSSDRKIAYVNVSEGSIDLDGSV